MTLNWTAMLLLAVAVIYSLLFSGAKLGVSFFVLSHRSMISYSLTSVLISPSFDIAFWGGSVVLVSVWLLCSLYLSKDNDRPKAFLALVPCGLAFLAFYGMFGFLPLAMASLSLVVLCIVFSRPSLGVSGASAARRLVAGALLILVFIELGALVLYNIPIVLNFPVDSSAVAGHWNLVELSLFNLAYPALPFGYLLFIALGILAFLVKVSLAMVPREKLSLGIVRFAGCLRNAFGSYNGQDKEISSGRFPLAWAILFSVVLSSLFVVITVLPWINPTYRLVSVDAPAYYQWLARMRGLDVNSALSFALANDRAVFMILSYALSFLVAPATLLQFAPALMTVAFCVVSVLVLRALCHFREVWVYAALISPFSFQVLGLIYSGYFANMLAVIFVFVYFILFLSLFRSPSKLGLFALLGVSLLVLFAHSWTWYVFMLSLCAFLFWGWRLAAREHILWGGFKWKMTVVGATGVVGLVCDLSRKLLTSMSASTSVFETAQSSLGVPNAGFVLGALRLTTNFYLGGVFANWLLIVLSILGFVFLLSFRSEMSRLLVSWIFVGSMPLLFSSGEFIFNRFLFLMPWIVLSGLGLSYLVRLNVYVAKNSRSKVLFELLVVAFVMLVLLNFGLRYVSNINI